VETKPVTDENKITKAIAAIIQETQNGRLVWKAADPPSELTKGTEDIVEIVYYADRHERLLRLFPFKTKYYTDEDVWTWVDDLALEVSDESRSAWWRFPQHRIITDLLEAVRFKTVGVDKFIDSVLSGEEPFG